MRTAAFTLALLSLAAMARAEQPSPAATAPLVASNTAFAVDLYRQVAAEPGNLFLSPYSISTALAMTREGTAGATRAQMDEVLHLPAETTHVGFRTLKRALRPPLVRQGTDPEARQIPAYDLTVANGLWGQRGFGFLPETLTRLRSSFGAGFEELDFVRAAPVARQTINRWVAERTRGRIQDLLPVGQPRPDARLVLANAIHFKAQWQDPFHKSLTRDGPFRRADRTEVETPFMRIEDRFAYGEIEGVQILSLPYRYGALSMIVVLPRAVDGLAAVEAKFDTQVLATWLGSLTSREVKVLFPRFRFTSTLNLAAPLAALGMGEAFTPKADFSRLARPAGGQGLFLGLVVHKAFVAVDEKGTEAAAATAVSMEITAEPVHAEPPAFEADRPFLFLIRHERTGSILFVGRVVDPTRA